MILASHPEGEAMSKIKIATDWLGGCSGCHMSLLDIDERLLNLLELVELTSSPITDLKQPPEEGVTAGILEGAVNTTVNIETAKRMRERSQYLIALGDCAVFGGIVTMRNAFSLTELLERAYVDAESVVEGKVPESKELGKLIHRACPVNQIVDVDVYLPGCPPPADAIHHALSELLEGRMPAMTGDHLRYD
jgi:NAD-reducing hydrogenase small subunit